MPELNIAYLDNHILAVVKPPGVPVQADASGDGDLLSMGKAYIKERCGKPGEAWLGLVHRLDRPVGGVVVFARTSKAAARLSGQIAARTWRKGYLAVVEGDPPDEGIADDPLLRDEASRMSRVVPPGTPGAQRALLRWRVLMRRGGRALLAIDLETGRHHQIRVQAAARGWPVWADARYGRARAGADIALWAVSVSLGHPVLGSRLTITAPPLPEGVWRSFL